MCTYLHVLYREAQEYSGNDADTPAAGICAVHHQRAVFEMKRRLALRWSCFVPMATMRSICAIPQTSAPIPRVHVGFPG